MALDERRNTAYESALAKVVGPESVVLDLGAGLGLHGLLAARLGAKRVYLVEPEDIGLLALEAAKANGLAERIKLLQGKIEDVEVPELVDVIVAVFTGNFLLEEDLLPSLFFARDRFLKPGGALIPDRAVMEAAPVHAPELHEREIASWSKPCLDLDLSSARQYGRNTIYYDRDRLERAQCLSKPADLLCLDLAAAVHTDCTAQASYSIEQAGICHGWAGWFRMRLGDDWLSTAPQEPRVHWSPAFLPVDPPIEVSKGDQLRFRLVRPSFGPWSWFVESKEGEQRHSTLFARPLPPKALSKISPDYRPSVSKDGETTRFVLAHMDGHRSVQDLARLLSDQFPSVPGGLDKSLAFVRKIMKQYG
jgi:SAM-dependent methyltransferase